METITLILHCQDGDLDYGDRSFLYTHFHLIADYLDDFPNAVEISLDLNIHSLQQLLNLSHQQPVTDQEWLSLFDAAQYLQSKEKLDHEIHNFFRIYFLREYRKGIIVGRYHHFDEYRKKIADHDYMTPEEIAYIRMLGRIYTH